MGASGLGRRALFVMAVVTALAVLPAIASARIVYSKGGSIYIAGNAGENPVSLGAGGPGVQFSGSGSFLWLANQTSVLSSMSTSGGPQTTVFSSPADPKSDPAAKGLFFTPDDKRLLFLDSRDTLRVRLVSGGPLRRLDRHDDIDEVAVSPDSRFVAYRKNDRVQIKPIDGGKVSRASRGTTSPVWGPAGLFVWGGPFKNQKLQLLNSKGKVKRTICHKRFKTSRAANRGGCPNPLFVTRTFVLTEEFADSSMTPATRVRVLSLSGKRLLSVVLPFGQVPVSISRDGLRMLILDLGPEFQGGPLRSVDLKTGKVSVVVDGVVTYANAD